MTWYLPVLIMDARDQMNERGQKLKHERLAHINCSLKHAELINDWCKNNQQWKNHSKLLSIDNKGLVVWGMGNNMTGSNGGARMGFWLRGGSEYMKQNTFCVMHCHIKCLFYLHCNPCSWYSLSIFYRPGNWASERCINCQRSYSFLTPKLCSQCEANHGYNRSVA